MNAATIPFLFLLIAVGCREQNRDAALANARKAIVNETEKNIYESGDSMFAAFNRKDWKGFVKYNNPNMTKKIGSAQLFESYINRQMKQIPDSVVKSTTLGKILQVVKGDKDLQCVVEQHMKLEQNGMKMDRITYLIGQSLDEGKNWTFFDASTKAGLTPKEIKPDLSSKIKIPQVKYSMQ